MAGSTIALLGLGIRNLRSQPALVTATIALAALIVALAAAVPLFARAVSGELFAVSTDGADRAETRLAWNGSVHGPTNWETLGAVDDELRQRADAGFELPDGRVRALVDSVRLQVVPATAEAAVGSTSLSWHDDLDTLVRVVEGRLPAQPSGPGAAVEVVVEQQTAQAHGVAVGSAVELSLRSGDLRLPALIVGTWMADDPSGWVTDPGLLRDRYFTDRTTLEGLFASAADGAPVRSARWLISSSATDLTVAQAPAVRAESAELVRAAQTLVPRLETDAGLADQLDRFVVDAQSLRRQMVVVMAPVLAGLAAFALLLGRQRAAARRREFGLWRLRGADERQVTTVLVIEAIALSSVATVLGLVVAPLLAMLLGSFDGFLDPSRRIGRAVLVTRPAVVAGVATGIGVFVALVSAVVPIRRQAASMLGAVALTGVAVVAVLLATAPTNADGFRDPAPFVVPVLLGAFAVGLGIGFLRMIGRRLQPAAVRSTRAASAPGLAVRRLGTSQWMVGPAVLLAVGVSVALTSASVGLSTDRQFEESVRHRIGADWVVQEALALRLPGDADGGLRADPMAVADWQQLDGVVAATRVGRWSGSVGPPGASSNDATILAVDPESFASVGWWRDDYAAEPLDDLLGRLGPGDVLVTSSSGLATGDTAELRLFTGTDSRVVDAPVVGRVRRAPTWSTDDSPSLVITTLDTVAGIVGDTRGFQTWVDADPGFGERAQQTTFVTSIASVDAELDAVRRDPVRRGVHGVLSFAAVVLLALGLVGGVVAVAFADRARSGERSLLRALGFGPGRLGVAGLLEAAIVLVPTLIGGAAIGILLSSTLLGRLMGEGTGTPPLRVDADLRLLPVLVGAGAVAAAAAHLLVVRRASAPIDLHSFVNEEGLS